MADERKIMKERREGIRTRTITDLLKRNEKKITEGKTGKLPPGCVDSRYIHSPFNKLPAEGFIKTISEADIKKIVRSIGLPKKVISPKKFNAWLENLRKTGAPEKLEEFAAKLKKIEEQKKMKK